METITPLELKRLLLAEEELALIDVREQGAFAESHLLFAGVRAAQPPGASARRPGAAQGHTGWWSSTIRPVTTSVNVPFIV